MLIHQVLSITDLCQKEELKNGINENTNKLNVFINLNNNYKDEINYHSIKLITLNIPKQNIKNNNVDFYDKTNIKKKNVKSIKTS